MEIIDKSHNQYSSKWGKRNLKPYLGFGRDMKRFFVNSAAVDIFELSIGTYAHFAIDIDRLYIYFNKAEEGVKSFDNQGGMILRSNAIITILSEKNSLVKPGYKFPLRKSPSKIMGAITLEVLLHNRIKLNKSKL